MTETNETLADLKAQAAEAAATWNRIADTTEKSAANSRRYARTRRDWALRPNCTEAEKIAYRKEAIRYDRSARRDAERVKKFRACARGWAAAADAAK